MVSKKKSCYLAGSIVKALALFLLLICILLPAAAQEEDAGPGPGDTEDRIAQPDMEPRSISIVPIIAQNAPGYTALVLSRLIQQNFDRVEVLKSKLLSDLDLPSSDELGTYADPERLVQQLVRLGSNRDSRYVTAGTITKDGTQYLVKMTVVDAENGQEVLTNEMTAIGLEDLDRVVRDFTDQIIAREYSAVVQEKVEQMRKEDARENARMRDDLAALEELAEEDPDEAIRKLPETVQRAVTEKAKQEVVQEEIEELYEQEKEETRIANFIKWQRRGMLTGYGFRFVSDMMLDLSIQSRIRALRYWSLYMNDYFDYNPYDEYRHFHKSSNGMVIGSYITGTVGSGGIAYSYMFLRDDVIEIRKGTRTLFAIANALYLSGRGFSYLSGAAGYHSINLYDCYMSEHTIEEIGDRYDTYRTWYRFYELSRYSAITMQLLGAAGITAMYFWPGEKEQLVLSDRSGFHLGLSNILSGAGAVCGQMALNFYAQGIESSIKARSPSGDPDIDRASMFNAYAVAFGVGAAAVYTTSAVLSFRAIRRGLETADELAQNDSPSLPFLVSIAPASTGVMSVVFEVRR